MQISSDGSHGGGLVVEERAQKSLTKAQSKRLSVSDKQCAQKDTQKDKSH